MVLSLITDEYCHDPATAFELGRRWGVEHYEIRHAYRFRLPVAPAWAVERAAAAVRDYGVKIAAVSPGLFKPTMRTDGSGVPISTDAAGEVRRHLDELLPRMLDFAARVGTKSLCVFALPKGPGAAGDAPAIVVESLAEAAEKARAGGFRLLLENVPGSWADSAVAALGILQAINSPALRMCWDPGNVARARLSEDAVRKDYPLLRPFVAHVHVKDVSFDAGEPRWTMIGQGVVDWAEQFRLLAADGYAGALSLEPHVTYQPGTINLADFMERMLRRVREMLSAAGL